MAQYLKIYFGYIPEVINNSGESSSMLSGQVDQFLCVLGIATNQTIFTNNIGSPKFDNDPSVLLLLLPFFVTFILFHFLLGLELENIICRANRKKCFDKSFLFWIRPSK